MCYINLHLIYLLVWTFFIHFSLLVNPPSWFALLQSITNNPHVTSNAARTWETDKDISVHGSKLVCLFIIWFPFTFTFCFLVSVLYQWHTTILFRFQVAVNRIISFLCTSLSTFIFHVNLDTQFLANFLHPFSKTGPFGISGMVQAFYPLCPSCYPTKNTVHEIKFDLSPKAKTKVLD